MTIVATGAKDKTHIVGRHADTDTGVGEGAVRCVYVQDKVTARIEGFTIRDGAASSGNGGGVSFPVYTNADGWLIDCVVSNCVAVRGGALLYGTAIRCMFTENDSTEYGKVASQSVLYNCLVVNNVGNNRLFNAPREVVNCTIAGNVMSHYSYSGTDHYLYNSIFLQNSSQKFHSSTSISNCLITVDTTGSDLADSGKCATNGLELCFAAPVVGDWRPREGSGAERLGDAEYLKLVKLPDESMRYVDYEGKPIPSEGAITCGAIQEVAPAVGGAIILDGVFEVEGMGISSVQRYCNYMHAAEYPSMFKMKAADATVSNIVWYSCTTGLPQRVPMLDGWVGVMPPPEGTMTIKPVYASKVIYADAENGNDNYEGDDIGSYEHPYKTLQAAVDAAPNGTDSNPEYSVICAKPGDYCDGGVQIDTRAVRLKIEGHKRIRVVALEGPKSTVIRGSAGENSGNGLKYSCVNMDAPGVVQGFTMTDGHCEAGNVGSVFNCGLYVTDRFIADCVISNNFSAHAIQRSGVSLRCIFLDNTVSSAGGGDLRNGFTINSVFRTSKDSDADAYALGSGATAYFTTYAGKLNNNSSCFSILSAASSAKFLDVSNDDYRLRSDSPAFGTGDEDPENYWQYANLDLAGNVLYTIDARPTLGAYQFPAAVLMAVDGGTGALSVEGIDSLTNTVLSGASVTVTKSEDCGRNLLGFELEDGSFIEGQTYTYTAPEILSCGQVDVIKGVFSTNWYVNAGALGSDANDGFTAATPKKTLAGVMSAAVHSGDTVHAAAGDYASGDMLHDAAMGPEQIKTVSKSRVVVPKGVTLVADEGADVTHIIGAAASEQYDVELGLGSNAVRCVALDAGARLIGFTLRDGRTNRGGSFNESCSLGGGVLGTRVTPIPSVEDCVISNCVAVAGGAGYSANFKRCRFFHNRALDRASVTRVSLHDSCIADWNYGARPFDYFLLMTNCTIGANQIDQNGNVGSGYSIMQPVDYNKTYVVDCLVLGKIHANVKMRRTAALSTSGVNAENCEDCILTNISSLAVDSNYRPIIGKNVAIDIIPLADDDSSVRAAKDIYGLQRVFNGARDLGALDADWRRHYAKTLGGCRITVTTVDPSVVEKEGWILIPEGSLNLSWRLPEGREIKHFMDLAVEGDGLLSVIKNEERYVDVTEATSGVYSFNAGGITSLSFAFSPNTDAGQYARIGAFSAPMGTVLIVR